MPPSPAHDPRIRAALSDIVEGRLVKRSRHELRVEGKDFSKEFVEVLHTHGYRPMLVRTVAVEPGQRVPAFVLDDGVAWFGWVFWEKFSQLRLRKLFGSVVRNRKGDWTLQIAEQRNTVIHANPDMISDMDIDAPSGF